MTFSARFKHKNMFHNFNFEYLQMQKQQTYQKQRVYASKSSISYKIELNFYP